MADLNDIAAAIGRIDGRTEAMESHMESTVVALNQRIDDEREARKEGDEAEAEVRTAELKSVRRTLKALPAAIASVVAATITGAGAYFSGGNS